MVGYTIINERVVSEFLNRTVDVNIYMPNNLLGNEKIDVLFLNDGQDVAKMNFTSILEQFDEKRSVRKLITVTIKASSQRIAEYGVADRPDFKQRGGKARAYTNFIVKELLSLVLIKIGKPIDGKVAFAGFSLGGLSAFDIAWNNPDVFDAVGVFSGSFWWRKKDLKEGYTDADRIAHAMIDESSKKPELKFWLMTGTEDEKSDRNGNGIIDSIDDAIDIIKSLLKKGYTRPDDIFYYEKVGGKHNPETWAAAMPAFLKWTFKD